MGYLNNQLEKRAFTPAELLALASPIAGAAHGHLRSEAEDKIPAAVMGAVGAASGAIPGVVLGMLADRPSTIIPLKKALPKKFRFAAELAGNVAPYVGTLGGGYLGAELGTVLGDKIADKL